MLDEIYDCHLHSYHSPCGQPEMTPENVFDRARDLGLAGLCLTDHLHYDTDLGNFHTLRREIQQADARGLEVWFGCEVDVLGRDRYTINPNQVDDFDLVLAAPLHWLSEADLPESLDEASFSRFLLDRLETTLDCPGVRILVHPLAVPSDAHLFYDVYDVIQKLLGLKGLRPFLQRAAQKNMGIEISPKYTFGPYHELAVRFYQQCLEEGVKLSLGSDAHSLAVMDVWENHTRFLNILGVTASNQLWLPSLELSSDTVG